MKRTKSEEKGKRNLVNYVVYVDCPINALAVGFLIVNIIRACQMGIDIFLAEVAVQYDPITLMMGFMCGVYMVMAFTWEAMYLIMKLCRKQPQFSGMIAISSLLLKMLVLFLLAMLAIAKLATA